MTNTKTVRFHQIMPADGWFIRENTDLDEHITTPLVGWGLTNEGDVVGLVAGEGLTVCPVTVGYYIHQSEIDLLKSRFLTPGILSR